MSSSDQAALGTVGGASMSTGAGSAAGGGPTSHWHQPRLLPAPHPGLVGRSAAEIGQNVGQAERWASGAAGSLLAVLGLQRRDLPGLLIAGVGGALLYRCATGHCPAYQSLGIDTAEQGGTWTAGVHVEESFLVNKSPEALYAYWRQLENLPNILSHLQSVEVIDERRSHWVAKAPSLIGGQVAWDAEIVQDEPNERIAWRSLPDGDVQHHGSVQFLSAPGNRGTAVRVQLDYLPPGGQIGRWAAKLFGEEPAQQIHDDLRNFKRVMEIGEVLTVEGQPRGNCSGSGRR